VKRLPDFFYVRRCSKSDESLRARCEGAEAFFSFTDPGKAGSVWTFEPDGVDFGQIIDPIAFE